jgi:putative flippase GtrA
MSMSSRICLLRVISHAHFKEAQRFFIIGICNFFFTYVIYLTVNLFTSYTLAFTVSFGAGILFSAHWNSRVSFSTPLTARRLAIFTVVCVINYFIGLQILKFAIVSLSIDEALAPILVVAAMVPVSFVATRLALVGSLTKGAKGSVKSSPVGGNGPGGSG